MGSFSDYAAHKLLDLTLGGQTFTRPANVFASLHTAALSADGSGAEVSGNNYSRKSHANDGTNYPAASGGSKALAVRQTFATASGAWGTVVDGGLWDASSGGNLLVFDVLETSQAPVNNDAPYLEAATGFVVTLPGDLTAYLANKLLDHVLGGPDFVPPANLFLALFVSGVEVSGNGYERLSVANNLTNFPPASGRAKSLGTVQQFANPTGVQGTVDEVRIYDANSGGNALFAKALATPRAIDVNKPARFPVGSLTFAVS